MGAGVDPKPVDVGAAVPPAPNEKLVPVDDGGAAAVAPPNEALPPKPPAAGVGAGVDPKPVDVVADGGVPPAPNEKLAPVDAGGFAGVVEAAPPVLKPPKVDGAGAGVVLDPNAKAGVPVEGAAVFVSVAGAGADDPNEKAGVPDAALSVGWAGVLPNENPAVPGAAGAAPFADGMGNDGVDPPFQKLNAGALFFVDGSAVSSFLSALTLGVGAVPNENPGIDAPPPFFSDDAGTGALALKENSLAATPLAESSFFSSDAGVRPNENPADDDGLVDTEEEGAAAAPAPNVNPPTAGLLVDSSFPSSRPRLDLAGVAAAPAAPPNENPPLPPNVLLEAIVVDDAAPPKLNPPAPMLALSSSTFLFDFAGVALPKLLLTPPLEMPPPPSLGASQATHCESPFLFFTMHCVHFHSPSLGLNMSPHPDGVVVVVEVAVVDDAAPPPKLNPAAPMLPALGFEPFVVAPSPELALDDVVSAPGLATSHAMQAVLSGGFFVEQVSHFHVPGGSLNKFPHPPAAGAGLADAAGGLAAEGGSVDWGGSDLAVPYLNAIGVDTVDDAAAPPGMKLYGAPDEPPLDDAVAAVSIAFDNAAIFLLGWGVPFTAFLPSSFLPPLSGRAVVTFGSS